MGIRYERGQAWTRATTDDHLGGDVLYCDECGHESSGEVLTHYDGCDYCETCWQHITEWREPNEE